MIPSAVVRDRRRPMSVGMLSTFPPTPCGIATFSAALGTALIANGHSVNVCRIGEAPTLEDPTVSAWLDPTRPGGMRHAIESLNGNDVVVVQHEYGLYEGPDGREVVGLMRAIEVPIVVVAHTVLGSPTVHQRVVLVEVCGMAEAVVVMTDTARRCLLDVFGVDGRKVTVVPHGAATPPGDGPIRVAGHTPLVLTWGLLGPGKGIEWAIDAFAMLADLEPRPRYLIAGATHPKVRELEGERYREMLAARARDAGLMSSIAFDAGYRGLADLSALIASADLVLLPYDPADQVTSGVLVDAVAAGRPVVSTAFPHAVELLSSGAGIVVPQRDPLALAEAIRRVLDDRQLAARMAAEARRLAPTLSWHAVAAQYADIGHGLRRDPIGHLR